MAGKKNSYGVDNTGVAHMAGYINGMTKEVDTGQYIGSVINYVHGLLAPRFDWYLDSLARAAPFRFHHVYEWPSAYGASDTIGVPHYRLWRQYIAGHGKSKIAGYRFVASRRPVPVHPLAATPNTKTGKHVKIGFHIFYWKAAVMEYGMNVTIDPKLGEWLTFVPPKSNFLVFTKKSINMQGGTSATRGAFTKAFVDWWGSEAGAYFDRRIAPTLANDLVEQGALSQRTGRSATKTFTISAGSNAAAYQRGEAKARAAMNKNEREYILGSLERMSNIGRL